MCGGGGCEGKQRDSRRGWGPAKGKARQAERSRCRRSCPGPGAGPSPTAPLRASATPPGGHRPSRVSPVPSRPPRLSSAACCSAPRPPSPRRWGRRAAAAAPAPGARAAPPPRPQTGGGRSRGVTSPPVKPRVSRGARICGAGEGTASCRLPRDGAAAGAARAPSG